MSAVHDRWELVEPFLFAHTLRDPAAFHNGVTTGSQHKNLQAIRRAHRFDDAAIAEALSLLGDGMPFPLAHDKSLHTVISDVSGQWLVAEGDHWALRVVTRRPGHEIIRWRGVTMLVPPSLIVAGALSKNRMLPTVPSPRSSPRAWHRSSKSPTCTCTWGRCSPLRHCGHSSGRPSWYGERSTVVRGAGIAGIKDADVPEIGRHANNRQPGMLWQWIP